MLFTEGYLNTDFHFLIKKGAPKVLELLELRRALLDQELEVGVEIAFGEQHVVGALFRDRGRRRQIVVSTGLQRRHEAGELQRVDRRLALEAFCDLFGEVDVEA